MDWNSIIPAIVTLVVVVVGFIWQTGYFKGKFTEKIDAQSILLDKTDKRLEEGQKTFMAINQSISNLNTLIATVTTNLTYAMTELKDLKRDAQTKDICELLMKH